jgi:hypothetical protein
MLGTAYGAFFGVGFLIYRGVKKNAEHLRALNATGDPSVRAASVSERASSRGGAPV